MPRYQDEYEENIWNDTYTCHCTHFEKPWCDCDKATCQECIEEEKFYANTDDYDGFGIEQDFINPETQWKYSIHYKFGDRTNELFATFLLGLQRLNDLGKFKEADLMMLEEMLENWKYGYLPIS